MEDFYGKKNSEKSKKNDSKFFPAIFQKNFRRPSLKGDRREPKGECSTKTEPWGKNLNLIIKYHLELFPLLLLMENIEN